MQCDLHVLGEFALLVLRLLAAVDLRITQGMGQEQVVEHAMLVIILKVLAKITTGMADRAELRLEVKPRDNIWRQNVGAAPELPPSELIPQFTVASLAPEIGRRTRQQPGHAGTHAAVWLHEG